MQAPCLFPTLRYRDADAALSWLTDVLGFAEHFVARTEGGRIAHAELRIGSSILMIGEARDDAYGQMIGGAEKQPGDALYLAVGDIDPLHTRVADSGATIEIAPRDTDYGSREFLCRDPEGNLWSIGSYWPRVPD